MNLLVKWTCFTLVLSSVAIPVFAKEAPGLTVAPFDMDVTPPIGSDMAYDPTVGQWDLGLRAKGIVLMGSGAPVVLCSFDWIGISSDSNIAFRECLAKGAGTTPDRVSVHTVHQHDAPACDFSSEKLLKERGFGLSRHDGDFAREVLVELEQTVAKAVKAAKSVTHVGVGKAKVEKVASNRRILGEDGKVKVTRFTSCGDPKVRAEPEGVIDPDVSLVSLWNGDKPVAVLSYYACHPQSYYRLGVANPDFPGVARFLRQLAVPDALHIHFNGAGGNLGAGKYNDGSHENRGILAKRLADGMKRAWESTEKQAITVDDVAWNSVSIALPLAPHLALPALQEKFDAADEEEAQGMVANLVWAQRCTRGDKVDVTCLSLGDARLLHMPGELFVEFQLQAKAAAPDKFVTMAAYGDYAPGYICTTIAYSQGGYEASQRASRVAPNTEPILMGAVKTLLAEK